MSNDNMFESWAGNKFENTEGQFGNDVAVSIGKPIRIYKFAMVSGTVTEALQGELNTLISLENLNQFTQIYTGDDPVTLYWEKSMSITGNPETNKIRRLKQVGSYVDAMLDVNFTRRPQVSNIVLNNIAFVNENYTTAFSVWTGSDIGVWVPNVDEQLKYRYLVLDERVGTKQFFKIVGVKPTYDPMSRELIGCAVDFEAVNLEYAKTGASVLDFFAFGGMGEGYSYPIEFFYNNEKELEDAINGIYKTYVETKVLPASMTKEEFNLLGLYKYENGILTALDPVRAKDEGVNRLQFDWNGSVALSDVVIYGRRVKETDNIFDNITDTPHRLLLNETFDPLQTKIFYNQPETTYSAVEYARPSIDGIWKSYKEAYGGSGNGAALSGYNMTATKTVQGGFDLQESNIINDPRKTASELPTGFTTLSYNIATKEKWLSFKRKYDLSGLPYIDNNIKYFTTDNQPIETNSNNTIIFTTANWLNVNGFINEGQDVMRLNFNEKTLYKLTDVLGVLGGIVNTLVGGLDIGWSKKKNYGFGGGYNFLLPTTALSMGMVGISNSQLMPLDIFNGDNASKVIPIPTKLQTSLNFSICDEFVSPTHVIDGAEIGKGKNGIWNTLYLGQTQDETGAPLFIGGSPCLYWANSDPFSADENTKFIVDYVSWRNLGQCSQRVSAYSIDKRINGQNIKPIYQSFRETTAQVRGDARLWKNVIITNFYSSISDFNASGFVTYPRLPYIEPVPEIVVDFNRRVLTDAPNNKFDDNNCNVWNACYAAQRDINRRNNDGTYFPEFDTAFKKYLKLTDIKQTASDDQYQRLELTCEDFNCEWPVGREGDDKLTAVNGISFDLMLGNERLGGDGGKRFTITLDSLDVQTLNSRFQVDKTIEFESDKILDGWVHYFEAVIDGFWNCGLLPMKKVVPEIKDIKQNFFLSNMWMDNFSKDNYSGTIQGLVGSHYYQFGETGPGDKIKKNNVSTLILQNNTAFEQVENWFGRNNINSSDFAPWAKNKGIQGWDAITRDRSETDFYNLIPVLSRRLFGPIRNDTPYIWSEFSVATSQSPEIDKANIMFSFRKITKDDGTFYLTLNVKRNFTTYFLKDGYETICKRSDYVRKTDDNVYDVDWDSRDNVFLGSFPVNTGSKRDVDKATVEEPTRSYFYHSDINFKREGSIFAYCPTVQNDYCSNNTFPRISLNCDFKSSISGTQYFRIGNKNSRDDIRLFQNFINSANQSFSPNIFNTQIICNNISVTKKDI